MRLFGYHIPGTRDLQKENEQLRERIALMEKEARLRDETEKGLREANHQLRMDLRQTNKMVDEWMSHYDELQRDLQREKQKVVSMKMEMAQRGVGLDAAQQVRELRGQQMEPVNGEKELAPTKQRQREGASQANLERIAEAQERRLAREARKNGERKEQTQQQAQGLSL